MDQLANSFGQPLFWIQPKLMERLFELRSEDDRLFAALKWKNSFRPQARVETAAGNRIFERIGWFNSGVRIFGEGSDSDVAIYQPKLFGYGWVEFPDGLAYQMRLASLWAKRWVMRDQSGNDVVTFKSGLKFRKFSDLFKMQGIVEIAPEARDLPGLDILVTLGWYLLLLRRQKAARRA